MGGKLTTFRSLGQDAVDRVCRSLGVRRRSTTSEEPLPGGRAADFEGFAARFVADSGLDGAVARRLADLYGTRAQAILDLLRTDSSLARPLDPANGVLAAEVVHAMDHEFARTLTDMLMQRLMTGLEPDVDIAAVESVAEVMAAHGGWDPRRTAREVDAYLQVAQAARPNLVLRPEAAGRPA